MSPEPAFSGLDPDKVLDLAKRCIGAAGLVRDSARTVNADLARVHPGEPAPYLTALNDFATWLEQSAADLTKRANAIAMIQAVDRLPFISLGIVVPLPAHRFPSKAQAEAKVNELLGKKKFKPQDYIEDPGKLEKLSREVARYATDPDFAAAFVRRFGTENLVDIPRTLQDWEFQRAMTGTTAGMYHDHYRQNKTWMKNDPEDVRGILYAFSSVLATATRSADADVNKVVNDVAKDDDAVALSWLMAPGNLVFGTDFLLTAFRNGVVNRIVEENLNATNTHYQETYPLGAMGGDGLPLDPKVKILEALARNSQAALAATNDFKKPIEVFRPGEESTKVKRPLDLLFKHGTYADKGAALGSALAAANEELHRLASNPNLTTAESDDYAKRANQLTMRMAHEVTRGRKEIDAVVQSLADLLARRHLDELHQSALRKESEIDPKTRLDMWGTKPDGMIGMAGPEAIGLSAPQTTELLAAISADKAAAEAFMNSVASFQAQLAREAVLSGADLGSAWAAKIGAFQGTLINAVSHVKLRDHKAAVARNKLILDSIDSVISFIPGSKLKDVVLSPFISNAAKDAILPEPSLEMVQTDAHWLKQEVDVKLRALVAATLHEAGALGAPDKVVADMEHCVQSARGAGAESDPTFFRRPPDGDGSLIPYGELDESQQMAFDNWVTGKEVQAVPLAREAFNEARDALNGVHRARG
ncbi:MAG: hypothetical protein ACRDZ3_23480 [Acidimicrobiia bacterium]